MGVVRSPRHQCGKGHSLPQPPHLQRNLGISLAVQWIGIHLPAQRRVHDPWPRKIPHASEQESLCATAAEPAPEAQEHGAPAPVLTSIACAQTLLGTRRGQHEAHSRQGAAPLTAARQAPMQQQRPSAAKTDKQNKK